MASGAPLPPRAYLLSLHAGTAEPPTAEMRLNIPQSLAEVDNGKIMGFAADLAEDHPVSLLS